MDSFSLECVHQQIDRSFPEHLARTQEFLRLPSISSENLGLVENAHWLQNLIRRLGGKVQLEGKPEAPIVYARFDKNRPKTLLVYGMYDVQPVAGQTWISPPFAAHIHNLEGIGPCIIARGACNSKAPLIGVLNVVEAIQQVTELPLNLILTFEGEEEIGSPSLPSFYRQNKEFLVADAALDPFWSEYGTDVTRPTLTLGSKGFMTVELVCRGGLWGGPQTHSVHSSVGAWIASPVWRLIQALAALVNHEDELVIEGLQEEIRPPSPGDENLLAALAGEIDEKAVLGALGAARFKYPLHGVDLLRKYLYTPAVSIAKFPQLSGDVIPAEARAQMVIRLVPEMNAQRTLELIARHLRQIGYADIEVALVDSYPWSRTPFEGNAVQAMIQAYQYHGRQPQIFPFSASASPYYLFSDILGIPYVWGGLGKAGGSHAPDEYVSVEGLKLFEKSIATFFYSFAGLSQNSTDGVK